MTDNEIDKMQASRGMDVLIAQRVFGDNYHPIGSCGFTSCYRCENSCKLYSGSIEHAWDVVEKLTTTTKQWFYFDQSSTTHTAIFQNDSYEGYDAEAEADTAPLAICRAALKCCKNVADKKEDAWEAPSYNEPNVDMK